MNIAKKGYKKGYDWLGSVIHWELYKQLIFDPAQWEILSYYTPFFN